MIIVFPHTHKRRGSFLCFCSCLNFGFSALNCSIIYCSYIICHNVICNFSNIDKAYNICIVRSFVIYFSDCGIITVCSHTFEQYIICVINLVLSWAVITCRCVTAQYYLCTHCFDSVYINVIILFKFIFCRRCIICSHTAYWNNITRFNTA